MQEENATYVSWTTPTKFLVADSVRNDCVAKAALGRDAAAGTVEVVETEAGLEEPGRIGLKQRCSGA